MNKSRLTLALSLAALFGGALLLPATASAHSTDDRGQRDHHNHHSERHHQRGNDWHLLHHREVRHHAYQPRVYRIHTQPHHRHHHRHGRRHHSPVRLKIVL